MFPCPSSGDSNQDQRLRKRRLMRRRWVSEEVLRRRMTQEPEGPGGDIPSE